jgi:hypothetical protein
MMPRLHAGARVALRVAVVGGAVLFLVRGLAWGRVAETLRGANLALLVAVVALNACMIALKAVRLRLLLSRAASFKACLLAKVTASAINNVTPFRGGDLTRLWMLERHARISKPAAGAVAAVEGLFELVALAAISFVAASTMPQQRWAMRVSPLLLSAAVILLAMLRHVSTPSAHVASQPTSVGRLRAIAMRLAPGTRALREPGTLGRSLVLSLVIWCVELGMVVLCARAIHVSIGPALAAVVLLGINLAMALPSMPAGAGAFEGGAVLVLVLSGVIKEAGVAFALLYHVVQVVPVTLGGLIVAWRAGIRLDRLSIPVKSSMGPGSPQLGPASSYTSAA